MNFAPGHIISIVLMILIREFGCKNVRESVEGIAKESASMGRIARDEKDDPSYLQSIEVRAVLVRCPQSKEVNEVFHSNPRSVTNISAARMEAILQFPGYDNDETIQRSNVVNCRKKIVFSLSMNNMGKTNTEDQFVVVDHVVDYVTGKKARLINPYVLKIKQEASLQLYALRFLNVVNGEVREEVINKMNANFTGCDDKSDNPTCGFAYYKDKKVPNSEGFCCSCDATVNAMRQPQSPHRAPLPSFNAAPAHIGYEALNSVSLKKLSTTTTQPSTGYANEEVKTTKKPVVTTETQVSTTTQKPETKATPAATTCKPTCATQTTTKMSPKPPTSTPCTSKKVPTKEEGPTTRKHCTTKKPTTKARRPKPCLTTKRIKPANCKSNKCVASKQACATALPATTQPSTCTAPTVPATTATVTCTSPKNPSTTIEKAPPSAVATATKSKDNIAPKTAVKLCAEAEPNEDNDSAIKYVIAPDTEYSTKNKLEAKHSKRKSKGHSKTTSHTSCPTIEKHTTTFIKEGPKDLRDHLSTSACNSGPDVQVTTVDVDETTVTPIIVKNGHKEYADYISTSACGSGTDKSTEHDDEAGVTPFFVKEGNKEYADYLTTSACGSGTDESTKHDDEAGVTPFFVKEGNKEYEDYLTTSACGSGTDQSTIHDDEAGVTPFFVKEGNKEYEDYLTTSACGSGTDESSGQTDEARVTPLFLKEGNKEYEDYLTTSACGSGTDETNVHDDEARVTPYFVKEGHACHSEEGVKVRTVVVEDTMETTPFINEGEKGYEDFASAEPCDIQSDVRKTTVDEERETTPFIKKGHSEYGDYLASTHCGIGSEVISTGMPHPPSVVKDSVEDDDEEIDTVVKDTDKTELVKDSEERSLYKDQNEYKDDVSLEQSQKMANIQCNPDNYFSPKPVDKCNGNTKVESKQSKKQEGKPLKEESERCKKIEKIQGDPSYYFSKCPGDHNKNKQRPHCPNANAEDRPKFHFAQNKPKKVCNSGKKGYHQNDNLVDKSNIDKDSAVSNDAPPDAEAEHLMRMEIRGNINGKSRTFKKEAKCFNNSNMEEINNWVDNINNKLADIATEPKIIPWDEIKTKPFSLLLNSVNLKHEETNGSKSNDKSKDISISPENSSSENHKAVTSVDLSSILLNDNTEFKDLSSLDRLTKDDPFHVLNLTSLEDTTVCSDHTTVTTCSTTKSCSTKSTTRHRGTSTKKQCSTVEVESDDDDSDTDNSDEQSSTCSTSTSDEETVTDKVPELQDSEDDSDAENDEKCDSSSTQNPTRDDDDDTDLRELDRIISDSEYSVANDNSDYINLKPSQKQHEKIQKRIAKSSGECGTENKNKPCNKEHSGCMRHHGPIILDSSPRPCSTSEGTTTTKKPRKSLLHACHFMKSKSTCAPNQTERVKGPCLVVMDTTTTTEATTTKSAQEIKKEEICKPCKYVNGELKSIDKPTVKDPKTPYTYKKSNQPCPETNVDGSKSSVDVFENPIETLETDVSDSSKSRVDSLESGANNPSSRNEVMKPTKRHRLESAGQTVEFVPHYILDSVEPWHPKTFDAISNGTDTNNNCKSGNQQLTRTADTKLNKVTEAEKQTSCTSTKPSTLCANETAKPITTIVTESAKPSTATAAETVKPTTTSATETVKPVTTTVTETVKLSTTPSTVTVKPTTLATTGTVKPTTTPCSTVTVKTPTTCVTTTVKPTTSCSTVTVKPTTACTTDTVKPTTSCSTDTVKPTTACTTDTVKPTTSCSTETVKPTTPAVTTTVKPITNCTMETLNITKSAQSSTSCPANQVKEKPCAMRVTKKKKPTTIRPTLHTRKPVKVCTTRSTKRVNPHSTHATKTVQLGKVCVTEPSTDGSISTMSKATTGSLEAKKPFGKDAATFTEDVDSVSSDDEIEKTINEPEENYVHVEMNEGMKPEPDRSAKMKALIDINNQFYGSGPDSPEIYDFQGDVFINDYVSLVEDDEEGDEGVEGPREKSHASGSVSKRSPHGGAAAHKFHVKYPRAQGDKKDDKESSQRKDLEDKDEAKISSKKIRSKRNSRGRKPGMLVKTAFVDDNDFQQEKDDGKSWKRKEKRQVLSSGQQIRGGQDCADRSSPPGVDPEKYQESAHCLRFSDLWYTVYRVGDPLVVQTVSIQLFEKNSLPDGRSQWKDVTNGNVVKLSTFNPKARDPEPTMSFEFVPVEENQQTFALDENRARVLIPQPVAKEKMCLYPQLQGGPREYLVVDSSQVGMDGLECDVSGVGFEGFSKQPDRCSRPSGTCLHNQPIDFWREDMKARIDGKKGRYFLENFGIVPREPIKTDSDDSEFIALEYRGRHDSAVAIEVKADFNGVIRTGTTAQITEVDTDSTCAAEHKVTLLLTNTGLATGLYQTRVTDCPAEAPPEWSKTRGPLVSIDPQQAVVTELTLPGELSMESMHCSVEVLNEDNELVATRRFRLQMNDRCICVWFCLCACIGSVDGLYCKPMSSEHHYAANFEGSLPIVTGGGRSVFDDPIWSVLIIIFANLAILLLLGLTKALLGLCCCPVVGAWGLHIIAFYPFPLDQYYERDIEDVVVQYDEYGYPIHPSTGWHSVRSMSHTKQFLLNVIFFLALPLAILFKCCRSCCWWCCEKGGEDAYCATHKCAGKGYGKVPVCNEEICFNTYRDDDVRDNDADRYVMDKMRRSKEVLNHYDDNERTPLKNDYPEIDRSQREQRVFNVSDSLVERTVAALVEKQLVFQNYTCPQHGVDLPDNTPYCIRGIFKEHGSGYKWVAPDPLQQFWWFEFGDLSLRKVPKVLNAKDFELNFRNAEEVFESRKITELPKGFCINLKYQDEVNYMDGISSSKDELKETERRSGSKLRANK